METLEQIIAEKDKEGHMSDQHKPLTAAEIEELRELEAKATPGPWEVGETDKYGQQTVGDKFITLLSCWHHSVESLEEESIANASLIAVMRNALPRLLSMLTPPTDAELREAVERHEQMLELLHTGNEAWIADCRLILRAVQAPRLTREQEEAVKSCVEMFENQEWPQCANKLRKCQHGIKPQACADMERDHVALRARVEKLERELKYYGVHKKC